MDRCERRAPPVGGPEKAMVGGFLDWQRATLLCKVAGLADEELPGTWDPADGPAAVLAHRAGGDDG
jgi:hypothetical protein